MNEVKQDPVIAMFLPDLRGGGAERVTVNLCNAYVERGMTVDVVLMQRRGELLAALDPSVGVVDLGARRVRDSLLPLAAYLRSVRPAALMAHMWPLPVIALWARTLASSRTRIIGVSHTTWSRSELFARPGVRAKLKLSMRLFYRFLDGLVAVSDGVAEDVCRLAWLPRNRVKTIYNPIVGADRRNLVPVALPDAWARGTHDKLLAVGTLKPIKDYPTLLRAFAKLRAGRDARLLILGEGDERSPLEGLVGELGLGEFVTIPGFSLDTRPYYAAADLFVLSSTGEGLPTVMVEALEQGIPVVSTDCPSGPREILADGKYGTLVPVGDVDALAHALEQTLSGTHDTEALKRRAQDFSVDQAADAYLDLLVPGWREPSAA